MVFYAQALLSTYVTLKASKTASSEKQARILGVSFLTGKIYTFRVKYDATPSAVLSTLRTLKVVCLFSEGQHVVFGMHNHGDDAL